MNSKPLLALTILTAIVGCTEPRVKRYGTLLDPLLGKAKKEDVTSALKVAPVSCKSDGPGETCEYRTALANNDPLPATHRQTPGFGPDLSPLDYYDVIFVTYDGMGIFKDWRAAEGGK